MISIYESKLAEKENIDPNAINSLESKVVHLAEENISLQVYKILNNYFVLNFFETKCYCFFFRLNCQIKCLR